MTPGLDRLVAPGEPFAVLLAAGDQLAVTDVEGAQAVDFLAYAAEDTAERYHMPNTLKAAGTIHLTTGHTLYSDLAKPLLTITEDSFGGHDTLGGACSAVSNALLYGVENRPGCRESFLAALAPHGLDRRDIVPNVNLFMRVPVTPDGTAGIAPGASRPGERIVLRADRAVLVALSVCPQTLNPCNGFNPTPARVAVFPQT